VREDVRVKMHSVKKHRIPFVLVAVAAVVLAACGSSGSTVESKSKATEPSSTTAAPSTTATTTGGAAPVVEIATNATLGQLLVDAEGKTLYTLTSSGNAVACDASCAKFWPPLLLPAGTTVATGGAGVTGLGTASESGGTQVTADGLPLYRFAADSAPGDANGEGVSSFGGTWHVVKVSGTSGAGSSDTSAPETTVAPSTTTTGGYGY
jgi:predicted lipoprotein with Yx(FWY)xxD motif